MSMCSDGNYLILIGLQDVAEECFNQRYHLLDDADLCASESDPATAHDALQ